MLVNCQWLTIICSIPIPMDTNDGNAKMLCTRQVALPSHGRVVAPLPERERGPIAIPNRWFLFHECGRVLCAIKRVNSFALCILHLKQFDLREWSEGHSHHSLPGDCFQNVSL